MKKNNSKLSVLSPEEKRELLKQLAEKKLQKPFYYPLSYGQRALWHIQKLMPETPVYNVSLAWLILSELDIPALQKTFQLLLERHPSLRTTYSLKNKIPVQCVHPFQKVYFKIHQASDWDKDELERELDREAHRPFNLETGPLLRVNLYIRSEGNHILLVSFHHIAVDLWSSTFIFDEIAVLYPAVKSGERPLASSSGIQYTDYVHWQRDMLGGAEGEKLWHFWKKQLAEDLPPLILPIQIQRSVHQRFVGAAHPFLLQKNLTEKLRNTAKALRMTLYTVLMTGFQSLLYKYSGQEAFFMRSLTVGRSRAEFEKIIGFFANPVVIKADFTGGPTFREVLKKNHLKISQILEHQDFPFEFLMEKLRFGKDIQYNPNPEIMFILQTPQRFVSVRKDRHKISSQGIFAPGRTGIQIDLGGLMVEKYNPTPRVTLNDLSMEMAEVGSELSGVFHYRTDLFLPHAVAEMAEHFEELLKYMTGHLDCPVASFQPKGGFPEPLKDLTKEIFFPKFQSEKAFIPAAYKPAGTPAEKKMSALWKEVLGNKRIGIHDNFFELGGTSLQALQLITLIREKYQIELPLRLLFEVRTISGLLDIISKSDALSEQAPIEPVWRDEQLPLSSAQERIWFMHQLSNGHPVFNIPISVRLRGPLDTAIVKKCVNAIIQRHEVLRTIFPIKQDMPEQVILPRLAIDIPLEDLSHLNISEGLKTARKLASKEAQKSFDLSTGPLLRIVLYKLKDDDHVAVLTMHHIISDGWSFGLFLNEFSLLYEAFSHGRPSPLPELLIQYPDFAQWQKLWLRGKTRLEHENFWKKKLKDLPTLNLPVSSHRPEVRSYHGSSFFLTLPPTLSASLKKLSEQRGVTLFMTLLGGFTTLLHRYSQQDDIAVGSPTTGRTRTETREMIGCFINNLVLRVDLSNNPSFCELLARIYATALEAYAHQDLPFQKVVEALHPERNKSRDPLFQIMFALQELPLSPMKIKEGPQIEQFEIDRVFSQYDLTLFMYEDKKCLKGIIEYSTELFDKDFIARMSDNFKHLLRSIVFDPNKRLGDLPLLSEKELHKITIEWNKTHRKYPPTAVHELIEKQAQLFPDSPAVVSTDSVLTYRELDQKANQLSRYILSLKHSSDKYIGICMFRSFHLIVSILAVLKSGAAYIPLDPESPVLRLQNMVQDSGIKLLFTQQDSAKKIRNILSENIKIVPLEEQWELIAQNEKTKLNMKFDLRSPAYVIYTSGSTGFPKGTVVSHQALSNYLFWCRETYKPDKGDGILLHSSLSFDFSITSLFGSLICGKPLFLAPQDQVGDPLMQLDSTETNWSLLKLTPRHAQLLGEQLERQKSLGRIHTLILGGEELRPEHISFWRSRFPQLTIINEYGPTEATVGCCIHKIPSKIKKDRLIPIGRPIANVHLYILDKYRNPVPVGVPGELYIGGVSVAAGYINQPKLTEESYLPDPFSQNPESRLFKSGDLARYLPSGDIEYLGRKDSQIKIRGYRIELTEVENTLLGHPEVINAAVTKHQNTDHDEFLTAYVIKKSRSRLDGEKLRFFLKEKLPYPMIPTEIIFMDQFPLTSGGKLDREALPIPDRSRPQLRQDYVPPETLLQIKLAALWKEILGIQKIGIHDDFFELGGHSLQALRLFFRMKQEFNTDLSLTDLMKNFSINAHISLIKKPKSRS